jgi:hypothetical protein
LPLVKEEEMGSDQACQISSEDVDQNSTLLKEILPLFGSVPLVFYLPNHAPQPIKDLITQNGG